jgi:predicted enzyme related to lactoylglutathione lyase
MSSTTMLMEEEIKAAPVANAITWFEIPTIDLERARTFYETLLATSLRRFDTDPDDVMCLFPAAGGGVTGALVQRRFVRPVDGGTMVYLCVDGQLDAVLQRARELGSDMLAPKTMVPGGGGCYACVRDSEGNHIGLHSRA